jgi:hypothetical protein
MVLFGHPTGLSYIKGIASSPFSQSCGGCCCDFSSWLPYLGFFRNILGVVQTPFVDSTIVATTTT